MGFVENDDMIEALPAKGTDQSLDERILPRRLRCDEDFFDAHVGQSLAEGIAVDAVAVADQVTFLLRGRPRGRRLDCKPSRAAHLSSTRIGSLLQSSSITRKKAR